MKALKDMTWEEAEPIFRAFHAGGTITNSVTEGAKHLALFMDSRYALPSTPVQKTIVPAAFWELFPSAVRVARGGGGWYGESVSGSALAWLDDVPGFVPGDDETEIVHRPVPDTDEWLVWEGGHCPVPGGTYVDVKFRTGRVSLNSLASRWYWYRHETVMPHDIVAYRATNAPAV